jgi:uncharacterized protein YjbJ (UPF0337 family)
MGKNIDEVKGRTKRAAGDLKDDESLRRQGRVDQAVSDVKEKIDEVADKVKEKVGGRDREPDIDRDRGPGRDRID